MKRSLENGYTLQRFKKQFDQTHTLTENAFEYLQEAICFSVFILLYNIHYRFKQIYNIRPIYSFLQKTARCNVVQQPGQGNQERPCF